MRVNVYAEEITDRIEIIGKEIEGHTFTGLRFYLELPATVGGKQHRGPFVHRPGDDDSAAVTFWGKRDLRAVLKKAQTALDRHYDNAPIPQEPEPQWSQTLDCGRVNHADAEKAVQKLNDAAFNGFTDWRLPTVKELLSLVDHDRCDPAIDTTRFPDTKSGAYWTSTAYAGDPAFAWFVSFGNGISYYYHRYNFLAFVRAVRGPAARPGQ